MNDYQIVCFGSADDRTESSVVSPNNEKCKKFIEQFCKENGIVCFGGVAFGKGLITKVWDALEMAGFKEQWTMFTSEHTKEIGVLNAVRDNQEKIHKIHMLMN